MLGLSVAVFGLLLKALPFILIAAGAGMLIRWYSTGEVEATPLPTNGRPKGQARLASTDAIGTIPDLPRQLPNGNPTRRQFRVRYPPDAVHDAIEKSLVAIGAKVRWDPRSPRHAVGAVKEGGFLGAKRHIHVTFGHLRRGICWVSVTGDSVEIRVQFERALAELVGPTRDLVDEYEAAWCRRFNEAMARKGDATRISPDYPIPTTDTTSSWMNASWS
ncbi:MAG TPA: hypothetical protein VHS28_00205 [Chloroflexota bacterium]|nr:hypothetical protein [Chloroflexota bacterium]